MSDTIESNTERKRRIQLGRIGIWASIAYLGCLLLFILLGMQIGAIKSGPLELNQLGDFLAGVFGPLALGWLVLGFFQQGHELRLQVTELRNSVVQQKELVVATREAVETEKLAKAVAEAARVKDAQPNFVIQATGGRKSAGEIQNTIQIFNSARTAANVRVRFDPPPVNSVANFFPNGQVRAARDLDLSFWKLVMLIVSSYTSVILISWETSGSRFLN
ncbi:MAG: hypothetical protein AAF092_02150 [Pseudomonadota bacterium]